MEDLVGLYFFIALGIPFCAVIWFGTIALCYMFYVDFIKK